MEADLPFAHSDELPSSIPAPANPIPHTLVNTRPLHNTPFVAPYVPVNPEVAGAALQFAGVGASDVLVDLGCGDARVLTQALSDHPAPPARCVGVELDPFLAEYIRSNHGPRLADGRLVLLEQDMFKVDLESLGATVMVLYLLPEGLEKLKPMIGEWLCGSAAAAAAAAGAPRRLVTITYTFPGWDPVDGRQASKTGSGFMGGAAGMHWLFRYEAKSVR